MTASRERMRWTPASLLLVVAVAVGLVAVTLWIAGHPEAGRIVLGGFGFAAAAILAVRMVRKLIGGTFGVDILAVIAILATVLTGEVVATLIIVIMIAGGSALEDFAQRRAEHELDSLIDREPRTAHVVDGDDIRTVAVGDVTVGERLLVRSGEVVPVDGILVSERAVFDDAPLTGESMPVERRRGEEVRSGSVTGAMGATITVQRLASDSQYQAIVALVAAASKNRAPMVRLADRFALPFTGVALVIAGVSWWLSGDPVRFAEVVVLATPCPLLLAAPVGFIAGMSRSARNGIVVKGGAVLETMSRIRTVVVDKTGTVTTGHPRVVRVDPVPPLTPEALLTTVAAVERLSSHVLAASIVASAEDRNLHIPEAHDPEEHEARGISARVGGDRVSVGTAGFISGVSQTVRRADLVGGELAVYVAVVDRFAGTIIASDPVRPEAPDTVRVLRQLGVEEIIMLTGDARPTAEHIAGVVGADRFHADCLPADKVSAVAALTKRPVLMVGDGINDAPVLAAADVGMAMGARGATAASEAAGAVILVDDFARVGRAVSISQDTVRIVYQSIGIGISVSVALMLIASFGLIPATLGATLQEVLDLATVLNALRALRGGQVWDRTPADTAHGSREERTCRRR